jgi:hypothetical protein
MVLTFSSLLVAVPAHFLREEPDDCDGCDDCDGWDACGRLAGAGAGAVIVLRLSTPRALDCRASDELSEPPNAPPPDVPPPVCTRTSGAGRETVGGTLIAPPLFAKPGRCAAGGVAPPRNSPENPGTVPGRLSCGLAPLRFATVGAGVEGVARAGRNVSADHPLSTLRDTVAVDRPSPCQTATPRGATRLRGAWDHQLPGRACPGPQVIT